MPALLFAYGTLCQGSPDADALGLPAAATHLGKAYVHGRLVDLQGFTALVAGGRERVAGEIWHVRDPALWERLDAHEGVGEPGWYRRELLVAVDRVGETRSVWAYTVGDAGRPA